MGSSKLFLKKVSRDCITQQTMVKLIYYLKKGSSNRENILPAPIFSRQFHFLISYQNPMKCSFEHIAVSLLSGVCVRSNKLKCHYCRWTINQWWELRRICTKTRNTFHLNCPKCSTHIILYFRFFIVVKLSFRVRLFSVYYLSDTRLTVRVACSSSFLSIFRSFENRRKMFCWFDHVDGVHSSFNKLQRNSPPFLPVIIVTIQNETTTNWLAASFGWKNFRHFFACVPFNEPNSFSLWHSEVFKNCATTTSCFL